MTLAAEPPRLSQADLGESVGAAHGVAANARHNVATAERVGSLAVGAALIAYALRRRDGAGVAAAMLGGAFVHRGVTGYSYVYDTLGVSTGSADTVLGRPARSDVTSRAATVNARKAIKVEQSVTIERSRAELYAFWRDFENLPRFMRHLVSLRMLSPDRSRWVAKAPAGMTVEWDAELVNDVPGTLIAWKSAAGSPIPNAGSVHFADAPGDGGTIVRLVVEIEPPGGRLGLALAKLFGEDPAHVVAEDLSRLKQLMDGRERVDGAEARPPG